MVKYLFETSGTVTCLICIWKASSRMCGLQSIHQFGAFTNSLPNSIKQSINMAELTSFD